MGASAHPGQKGREKNAHQLQTALAHTDRAKHEERRETHQHGHTGSARGKPPYRTLWAYLADLNEQAEERLDLIIEQMKAAEEVTEEMKARNQLEWVERMNNIRNRAEEIINSELIYI